jgi:transcriptional regulator with XRE-family HTH domain
LTARRSVSPTVRRRRLGAELRRYREAAGLTIDHVADRLDCSASKISRLETGQTGSSPRDVRDMLALYQVGEPELEELMAVARETRQRGWWQPYGSVLTGAYVGFEAAAELIRSFEAQCMPGLLQIEGYARSVIRSAKPDATSQDVQNWVKVRLARAALLTQEDPVTLWSVIDESVLRRQVGGREVMKRQLEHVVATAELPNVTIQVLPLEAGAHPGMEGSFVLLRFPDEADPDTVYVTMATGGVFQEKADELLLYATVFDRLRELALPPEDSIALVARLAKELP